VDEARVKDTNAEESMDAKDIGAGGERSS